jgi:diguanylate cyclase (GGDEF)-like protein
MLADTDTEQLPTLLLIDLDGFKLINDTYGHAAGDACLIVVAERLTRMAPHANGIARLGGDEFALVFDATVSAARIEATAEAIVAEVQLPFDWQGNQVRAGTSIGIASEGITVSEIMRRADMALYAAKGAGRGQFRFYDVTLDLLEGDTVSLVPHASCDEATEIFAAAGR